jgi:hypothetical protein
MHLEPEGIEAAALRRNSLWTKASRQTRVYAIRLTLPKELGSHCHRVKDSAERGDPTRMEFVHEELDCAFREG